MNAKNNMTRKHIRRPDLPWRSSKMSECGRPIDHCETMDRSDVLAMIKKDGKQRTAYVVCMTCMTTAAMWPEFDQDPVKALSREFFGATDPSLSVELRAIGMLVDAHREEYEATVAGLLDTVSINCLRRKRQQREARQSW